MEGKRHNVKPVRKLDAEGNCMAEYGSAVEAASANGINYHYFLNRIQKGKECKGFRYEYFHRSFTMPKKKTAAGFHAKHNPYDVYTAGN